MSTRVAALRRLGRRRRSAGVALPARAAGDAPQAASGIVVDLPDDDPFLDHMLRAGRATELDQVELDSPAVRALRAAGVTLVVPLITQGELLGLLNLGPRLSEQGYSSEDRRLLDDLAGAAAPAVRIAQLVRQQELEVRERSRIEQELRVATLIQQQFLPRTLPELEGWQVEAFYRPAREVGGDFYDFVELPDQRIGIVVGDVTDKGVPAALIMAKTHSILRGAAPRLVSPGAVLVRANDLLVAEMPANMFVTCLFAVLDPVTGVVRYANAGHPVPYVRGADGRVRELRARGMPLGLLPGMVYEEAETVLAPGERVLLHSDGAAEAHDADRAMFGFTRLAGIAAADTGARGVIDDVLEALAEFVPAGVEQEDDITLVALARSARAAAPGDGARTLLDCEIASVPGNERLATERLDAVLADRLERGTLERLRTAVAEATMNAIEHGNGNDPSLAVRLRVLVAPDAVEVRVSDRGRGPSGGEPEEPDLDAKLAGRQPARGWGLFLIRHLVDDLQVSTSDGAHTVALTVSAKGVAHAQGR